MSCNNDTIVSRVTPEIRCNIGIIRVSGPLASKASMKVLGKVPLARYASYLPFLDITGKILDRGIALWFPKPRSFTGEDSLELQGHGNPIIIDLLIANILSVPTIRLAKPGEFSERAFLNGKMDLVQAESIVDLINANSEQAARAALQSLQGLFSFHINKLVKKITKLRVTIEALINFSEEMHYNYKYDIESKINELILLLNNIYNVSIQGTILREGIKIVICGYPNSGKSSLLNVLSCINRSIVTDIPGTTRDLIYECININGLLFHLVDTAGLRVTGDIIERIGIKFAWKEINLADHILFVIDGSSNLHEQVMNYSNFIELLSNNVGITIVFNKSDLLNFKINFDYFKNSNYILVSTKTGKGIKKLRTHLYNLFKINKFSENNEGIFLARRRHIKILIDVLNHIKYSKKNWKINDNIELLAEDLRICHENLNNITGAFTSDQLLSDIFSDFCIGK
ncbi:tRNA uridine-5-carboxymethylaminomethyl(34) synthesis GTPase MnmE [Buchnera aphidicola]|uniref:tRNA modification GTPase MnmE n=1 Tax=Buchnera aphidicola subsp. Melaphis rhois TaxID=118103 RepID=A0A4D6Y2I1_BUCMH|nr:tRNA uridine-5-carboxymethylaminomethyl(34) synthesis GTPase MnmE [Buchnera aphidicola]QCI23069.1 tRNA uridine-5-carboxymethylaminomethyl(34) synthesis GTPase MnmE [Buchnera aphidicola (Melaphis rhois)]